MDGQHIGNEQRWLLKFDQCELLAVVDVVRELRVDFLKLAPSRHFETRSHAVKTIGSHLKVNNLSYSLFFCCKRSEVITQFRYSFSLFSLKDIC